MSSCRSSNQKRTEWNKRCRQILSDNISEICDPLGSIELTNVEEENLGILIEPAQVRLQTENTNDPYTWDRTEEKNHLFQKNISDHPIGKLKELSEGVVGKSIAAVAKKTAQRFHDGDVLSQGTIYFATRGGSFAERIEDLQENNKRSISELNKQRDQTALQVQLRQEAEEEVLQLKAALQDMQRRADELEDRIQKSTSEADHFRRSALRFQEGLRKILPVLEEI